MAELWIMLKNVLVFVLLAVPGFLLVKTKVLKATETNAMSALLTYVGMPFLILSNLIEVKFTGELLRSSGVLVGVGAIFYVVMIFLSALVFSKKEGEEKKRGAARFCTIFSNAGFLAIPLAQAVFGDSVVVTYAVVLNVLMNVLMFTVGVVLISGDRTTMNLKKVFLNPILISFVLGIILNLLKVGERVSEVAEYATYFKNVVTPLSMVVVGMKLGDVRLAGIFTNGKTYYVSLFRLVVFPVLGVALMIAARFLFRLNDETVFGFFMGFSMPTASLACTFADRYEGDVDGAVAYVMGTTILSVASVPLLYALLCVIL